METESQKDTCANSAGTVMVEQTQSQTSLSGEIHIVSPAMSLLDEITSLTSQMAPFGIMQTMFSQGGQRINERQQQSIPISSTDNEIAKDDSVAPI